jgi:hypothetical protein
VAVMVMVREVKVPLLLALTAMVSWSKPGAWRWNTSMMMDSKAVLLRPSTLIG